MTHNSTKNNSRVAAVCFVVVATLLFIPSNAAALPITEYQQNLERAISELERVGQLEGESTIDYDNRFLQTIENVRVALPEHQDVESEGEVCKVDNSWLHRELDTLQRMSGNARVERARQVVESLRAIEARVAERQQPARMIDSKEQAKSKLENILARPEYVSGARGPNALTRLLRDFIRWLQKLLPKPPQLQPGSANWLSRIAQIVVIGFALLVLAYVVMTLLTRFKRSGKLKQRTKRQPRIVLGERLEPEETATDLLSEAEALARRGDLRAAIRKAYIALLVELGDRKLISLAQHKTNRDYLNSVRNVPQLHSRMRGLTDSFERHWYGFAQATQNDWQDFREGYLAALHSRN